MAKNVIKLNKEQLKHIISESIFQTIKKNRDINRLTKKIERISDDIMEPHFVYDKNNCNYYTESGRKVSICSNGNVYCVPPEERNVVKIDLFTLLFEMDDFYKTSNESLAEKIAKWCERYLERGVNSRDKACEIDTWLL